MSSTPSTDRNNEPTPVPAPPAESSPSSTGLVADDSELREAAPAENEGERG